MLSVKQGDNLARADLLGVLLVQAGFKPFLLRHGTGRQESGLILLELDENELKALSQFAGRDIKPLRIGAISAVPCPLEPDAEIGSVEARLYDADRGRWTAGIAVSRFKP